MAIDKLIYNGTEMELGGGSGEYTYDSTTNRLSFPIGSTVTPSTVLDLTIGKKWTKNGTLEDAEGYAVTEKVDGSLMQTYRTHFENVTGDTSCLLTLWQDDTFVTWYEIKNNISNLGVITGYTFNKVSFTILTSTTEADRLIYLYDKEGVKGVILAGENTPYYSDGGTVTNNVTVRCDAPAGNNAPEIAFYNAYRWTNAGNLPTFETGYCITKIYDLPQTFGGSVPCVLEYSTNIISTPYNTKYCLHFLYNGTHAEYWRTCSLSNTGEETFSTQADNPFNQLEIDLPMSVLDDCYIKCGDTVLFAGENTEYYREWGGGSSSGGDDTVVSSGGVNYPNVAWITEATTEGDQYREDIQTAKNAWMSAQVGNRDKIPVIIHTDQHVTSLKPFFDAIKSGIIDWYTVSKCINLGDMQNSNTTLDDVGFYNQYLQYSWHVPWDKRIEIYGNHDVQGRNGTEMGYAWPYADQSKLYRYFKNPHAKYFDSGGNFVDYDDQYRVKYLCLSGFTFDSSVSGYTQSYWQRLMRTEALDWAIDEMSKNDGYRIVVLSHCPIDRGGIDGLDETTFTALWSARKAKTSGSITDGYGVTHTFDFSNCESDLICALHGHMHTDGHAYVGGVCSAWFDWYNPYQAVNFVLIDIENDQLQVWKVDTANNVTNYTVPLSPTT